MEVNVLRTWMGRGLSVFGLLFLVAPGCGDDKPKIKVEEDPYPDLAAFCVGIAQAQCAKTVLENCGFSSDNNEQCTGEVSRACLNKGIDITRNIKNTGNYRKDKAVACVEVVGSVYAKARITKEDHTSLRTSCDQVFRGKETEGFACEVDLDCDEGLACYRSDLASAKGTCEKPSEKARGELCDKKGDFCAAGSFCSAADKGCLARPESGGNCSAVRPCVETLACTNLSAEGTGTCGPKKVTQEECVSDTECQSGFCALVGARQICLETLNFGTGSPVCENFDGK
jgi:hypothetical protein